MISLLIHGGANGNPTDAITPTDTFYEVSIAASTNQQLTAPAGSKFALFSGNGDFYVRYDGTAATVPSSSTWTTGNQELNPGVRKCAAGDTFDVIAPTACKITVSFYS